MDDVRYALRLIVRQPLFACIVVSTLMLGIGASTSMFAVVNGVLLKPLPYADPSALVWMFGAFRGSDTAAVSPPDFVDYRRRIDAFERLAAMAIGPNAVTVTTGGTPARLRASSVSAELMSTLGVAPILGRDLTRDDETAGSTAVIVSHRLWQERFGGASDILGQSIVMNNRARTVVGVMPPGFTLPYDSFIRLTEPVDLYLPIAFDHPDQQIRRFHSLRLIGRLKPGVSLRHAQSEMDVIAHQLAAEYPENDTWHLRLLPLYERIVGAIRPVFLILMAAVTLLLIVSCANVASLLLARASTRKHELALRSALGASPARIVRQLLVEGFALSLAGGAAGVVVTWWTIYALRRLGPAQFPRLEAVALDPRVVLFALAAAAVTTLMFALAPAIHAARGDVAASIAPARTATHDRSRRLAQRALVVGQLAVSVVLLAAAALLVRGFVRLVSTDSGFSAADVMLTPVPLPDDRYDTNTKVDSFYSALLERLTVTPGIDGAALATAPPLAGANDTVVYRQGRQPATPEDQQFAQVRQIQGDYFRVLGIPLVAGRAFDNDIDRAGLPNVVIVSRRMAQDHFGGVDGAIGQRLVVDLGDPVTAEVVGVTGDVRIWGPASESPPVVYMPARQHPAAYMQVILKCNWTTADVAAAIRHHVTALDPSVAVGRIDRMDVLLADSVAQPRFSMVLIGSFAALALMLTLVGLHGTLAYLVAQRQREIGIRMAMGATPRDVRQMVLMQGIALIAIGIPLGLVASLFTSRLASTLLVDVQTTDPLLHALIAALLTVASLVAMLIPANRAARVEPLVALRTD